MTLSDKWRNYGIMEKHILCNGDSKTYGRCTNLSEEIVTATAADLPRILEIYDIAKTYMRANGNPNQWNGAYPDPETLRTDIEKQRLYVYKKDGCITGYSCFYWRRNRPMPILRTAAGGRRDLTARSIAWRETGK